MLTPPAPHPPGGGAAVLVGETNLTPGLQSKQRKIYRHLSRKQGKYRRSKRSEQGFGKRPEDMESDSYRQQVADILHSYKKDDEPFFIFLSFFTKSYRLDFK